MINIEILTKACINAKERLDIEYLNKLERADMPHISAKEEKKIRDYISALDKKYFYGFTEAKALASSKHSGRKLLRSLLIAAAIVVLLLITALAVPPFRNFFMNVYYDCTEIIFSYSDSDDYLYARYDYIPEGYELLENKRLKNGQIIVYGNGDNIISVDTSRVKSSKIVIDTEQAETAEIEYNGLSGYFSETDDNYIFVWSTGKYYHCITADIADSVSRDEILKIACSRVPEKNSKN